MAGVARADGVLSSDAPPDELEAQVQPQIRLEGGVASGARPELTTGFLGTAEVGIRGRGAEANLSFGLGLTFGGWPGDRDHRSARANVAGLRPMGRLTFTRAGLRPYVGLGALFMEFTPLGIPAEPHFSVLEVYEVGAISRGDAGIDFGGYLRLCWVDPLRDGGRSDDPAYFELGVTFELSP